nr:E-beta-farnesene synthase [Tanacetum cinerariifolium]
MAGVNVTTPADQAPTMAPPIHTDDQILPHIRWVPIGKSNCYLDVALTTIINLCLTGKRSGFERPRAPVLRILWGVVNRAHLDYAERIWEEFTQSIHTFIEDKRNMAQHTHGKKKATLIVIPSIQFTKLIIYHLQRQHEFYLRPDSPLYLPNKEPDLGYLKFSAKETKREVFGMPFPGNLITTDIQGASYYQEYLAKVAKHQRYMADETGSDPDSPAAKPTKTAKKPKPTAPKADPRLQEPRVDDEEDDVQRALEESLKSMYVVPRGPLPPVVIREPESGKYQPLPESPADRYIFQRRTSAPTRSSGHDESSSLYAELGLTDGEGESDEDVPRTDAGIQGKGQDGPDPDAQDEGHAGSNPDEQAEGHAGPDPGDAEASQPLPSPVVHAGSDLEHIDLDVADVSTQPPPEQMDESDKPSEADNDKATAETEAESIVSVTIQQDTSSIPPMTTPIIDLTSRPESPKVHQLFKATAIEKTTTTIHPPPSQQQQSTTNSMMMKRIAPLRNRFRDLPEADMKEILHQRMWETDSYKTHEDHMQLYEALEKSMNRDHSEELAKDLAEACKKKKKRRDSPKTPLGSPPHQPPHPNPPASPSGASRSSQVPPPPPPPPSTNQEGQSKGSVAPSSSKTTALAEYQAWTMTDTRLRLSISMTPADLQIDNDMTPDAQAQSSDDEDIVNAHIPKVNLRQDWWKPLEEERPATPEPAWSISSSDVPVPMNNWASALASTYLPPPEDSLLTQTGDIAMFMDWFCKRQGITKHKPQDLEGLAFEIIKVFHPNVIHLQSQIQECYKILTDSVDDLILRHNVSKPLPLGGPPGHVTIQSDFFFNKDLEYLRYGRKGSRPALSISKMKVAYNPDAGLEQMVPDQMWIKEECKHTSESDCRAVMTHMRILSVVRIEVFSMYGYDYTKKIVLRCTDLNEHVIAE